MRIIATASGGRKTLQARAESALRGLNPTAYHWLGMALRAADRQPHHED